MDQSHSCLPALQPTQPFSSDLAGWVVHLSIRSFITLVVLLACPGLTRRSNAELGSGNDIADLRINLLVPQLFL